MMRIAESGAWTDPAVVAIMPVLSLDLEEPSLYRELYVNRSRVLPVAVSLTAVAALVLTGCGGGDKKASGNDKIAGADTGSTKKSASPSSSATSKAPHIDRPEMKFPTDVKLVFAKADLQSSERAAAANDADNFVRAVNYGIVKQGASNAAYKFYSEFQSPAQEYAKDLIKKNVDAGYTLSGVQRFTGAKVEVVKSGKSAVVSFCSDSTKFYSKEVRTQKVHRTQPSSRDYTSWQILMVAADGTKGLWRAKQAQIQDGAKECQQ
ncbi:hypothetical protein AB0436_20220 [Streptomyces sp. NPDC051322]|uniref:hypothetical protein n=1 Tax=Streptomyces sp. NPDC051322 TaxID=3154645 RepID=UPI00344B2C1F